MKGRSKSFDQLLLDHRAAKEAALIAKQEAAAVAHAVKAGGHPNVCLSSFPSAACSSSTGHTLSGGATVRALTTMHGTNIASVSTNKLLKISNQAGKLVPTTSQLHKCVIFTLLPIC